MEIDFKTHQRLERFCVKVCTGKIGWNRERRKKCRETTMCRDCMRRKVRLESDTGVTQYPGAS